MLVYLLHIFGGKSSRAQREVNTQEAEAGATIRN